MPGYFFPAPPTFIGGRQPYAPRLGLPPGSPGDRQTRTYVTLAICIAAWAPATFNYLPPQTRIAPFLTPPGPPPPTNNARLFEVIRSWDPAPFFLPEPVEIASQIAPPIAPSQPPTSNARLFSLLQSWDPKPFVLPEPVEIASQVSAPAAPTQPPGPGLAIWTIRSAWEPAALRPPTAPRAATIPSAPDVPPPRALSTPQIIGLAWTPTAYYWLPPQTRIAAQLPSFSAIPPARVNATPPIIGLAWTTPNYLLPSAPRVAALQPSSVPPPRSMAPFAAIRAAWIQAPYSLPELANFAPLIPPPASTPPPPRSRAVFEWIRRLWDPQPITPQRSPAPPHWTPVLTGGPRYIVKQPGTREFTVEQDARRPFAIAQLEPRLFTITSDERHNMGFKFEIKEPHELIPLTFDFTPDLLPGETLANTPTVSVAVVRGADANPSGVFNGSAGFDSSMKKVIVPVQSGVAQADYEFTVTVDTTTATKRLTLVGVLPVRSKFE